MALPSDHVYKKRVGLEQLSMAEMEAAPALLDTRGVSHGDLLRLDAFGIAVPPFHDPDNIQVELTAPLG